ncbi:competence protein CoiA family protein [Streptomyces noursei]
MTHNVLHRGYGITIDLSASDLGHPDRPGLLQEIHRNYKPDLLYCLGAHEYGTACPGFMTIVEKNGRYHARHVTKGEVAETVGESELHKALKNHTALTADREGFGVTVEDRAVHGRRRTDVTVAGASGKKIGYEIQISPIASGSVDTRTRTAMDDGLIPLWLVTNENSLAIDRAPWARLNVQRWQDFGGRDALRVRGGVKALRMVRCDWATQRACPKTGTRCGGWHATWESTQAHYDDMVRMTATGELVTLFMRARTGRRRGWHMWVRSSDKEEFLQGRPEPDPYLPASVTDSAATILPAEPLLPDPHCHYGEDTGIRAELTRPRDNGDPIDASDWLSKEPPPEYRSVWTVHGWEDPGDVVAARLALDSALQRLAVLADALPTGADIAAGRADFTPAGREGWLAAQEECRRLAAALATHPWLRSAHDSFSARRAVFAAARKAQAAVRTNTACQP